jgi:hypothetical protein
MKRRGKGKSFFPFIRVVCIWHTVVSAYCRQYFRNIHMAPHTKKAVESRPLPFWRFVMLAADIEQMTSFLHEVRSSERSSSIFAVFLAISAFVERDTGALTCSQRQLARTAGVNIGDVYRALERLIEMRVLIREGKGKYRVHPSVMWRGQLALRGQAEETAPRLTLVEGGRED